MNEDAGRVKVSRTFTITSGDSTVTRSASIEVCLELYDRRAPAADALDGLFDRLAAYVGEKEPVGETKESEKLTC